MINPGDFRILNSLRLQASLSKRNINEAMKRKDFGLRILLLVGQFFFLQTPGWAQLPSPSDLEIKFQELIDLSRTYVVTVVAKSSEIQLQETVQSVDTQNRSQSIKRSVVDKNVGSGLIIDSSGIILTRRSVIDRTKKIWVELHSGKKLEAKLLGIDEPTHMAILKVPEIPVANPSLANEKSLKMGNWVFVMGGAPALSSAVAFGVVEAMLDRNSFLISARPWRGCSGAPVFNLNGQVIGMLAARVETSTEFAQLNWTDHDDYVVIPIAPLLKQISEIIKRKIAPEGWIGMEVTIVSNDPDSALFEVTRVYDNSPAAKAGIQVGDQLLSYNGKPIRSIGEISILIRNNVFSDSVQFDMKRGSETLRKKIEISVKAPASFNRRY